jgi:hypothetical protein
MLQLNQQVVPHPPKFVQLYYFSSPIVEMKVALKASSENLNNTQVFPTPESPIKSNLNK